LVILVILSIFSILVILVHTAFNLYLILFRLSGYELSSDDDEPALQPDDPADSGNALDDMQPPIGPPILQQPPAPILFDFASFMRCSGGNTTSLLADIREADAQLPPGPIVVYSERAGGAARSVLCILDIFKSYFAY
jgi:hypothetical protein